jgi:hypothetical protein
MSTVKSALPAKPSRFDKEHSVMHVLKVDEPGKAGRQAGFALVLAILSLMLLTFLGLTLAATTSTELQIATNYRWSQQALYNAEAGLEAAKIVLAQEALVNADFRNILPTARKSGLPGVPWNLDVTGATNGPPVPSPAARSGLRDYERMGCTDRAGVGYGRILTSQTVNYQDVSQFMGTTINGAFTVWVRRDLETLPNGQFQDSASETDLVVTAEGIAPFTTQADAFLRANQSVRILEVGYSLLVNEGKRCQGYSGQEGLGPSGENFDPCSPLGVEGVRKAFRIPTGTPITDTGAQ